MKNLKTDVRVALVSNDTMLSESLARTLLAAQDELSARIDIEFFSESERVIDLSRFDVVIYDIDVVAGDLQQVTLHILEYKNSDPSTAIVLIGDQDDLALAVVLDRIAPLIERSLNKPINSSQLLIAIEVVSQKLYKSEAALDQAKSQKTWFLPGAIIVLSLVVAASIFFLKIDNQESTTAVSNHRAITTPEDKSIASVTSVTVDRASDDVVSTYELALLSKGEGKLILPKGNNALFFLDQVLDIDPYHEGAYRTKLSLLEEIRASFTESLKLKNLGRANKIIEVLTQGDPFNKQNAELRIALKRTIEKRAPSQSQENLILNTVGDENNSFDDIYTAIKAGDLISPKTSNAYSLLLNLLQQDSLNEADINSAKAALANALILSAKQNVTKSEIAEASNAIKYIRNLDTKHPQLPELRAMLVAKKNSIQAENEMSAKTPQSEITPFKVLTRTAAVYPRRARDHDIEGWVEVRYQVNEEGKAVNVDAIRAEPEALFDRSAINAIKSWTFSPSVDSLTGEPVLSKPSSSKFNFVLDS